MTRRRLAVVSAGLSQPSSTRLLADQLAAAVSRELGHRDVPLEVRHVEIRDHAHDLVDNVLTGFPAPEQRNAIEAVQHADGLVAVTPIFNASYSGLFKSFFDVFDESSLDGMPVLIAATGGTPRHSLALEHAVRPLFSYLRSIVVPTSVFAAAQDWGSASHEGALADRIARAGRELAVQMHERAASRPADAFEAVTPFDALLTG
jgi:FMN reductase